MTIPVELIFRDNPGNLPASQDLPASVDMEFASSRVRINGAGAASSFIPVLEVLDSAGVIIAQARPDQVFAAGDTGVVTFAPFLRRRIVTSAISVTGAAVSRDESTPQSAPSSATYDTTISWTTEVFDTANIFDAGAPTRLTAQADGIWLVNASAGFVSNATGDRAATIMLNGTTQIQQTEGRAPAVFFWAGAMSAVVQMAAGDFVDLRVAQNSGGNLDTGDCFMSAIVFAAA